MGFLKDFFGGDSAKRQETSLQEYFESGLEQPFKYTDEKEALCGACKAVGEFTHINELSNGTRVLAMTHAGSYVGCLKQGELRDTITSILERCCKLKKGETLQLTAEEKQFIKNGIEGRFFR
ncbi:hypothetical protein [Faecalibaculum rodentium]|uniref:hypothetical protein n=1 Tax=Faecalibaculum rodentium TaxID=1702221 RepID=UPI00272C5970|nr:hypothetical protein [Faecalibaculum rodentium]